MSEKNQESEAPRGPLIFTVPACGLIVALNPGSRRPTLTDRPPVSENSGLLQEESAPLASILRNVALPTPSPSR